MGYKNNLITSALIIVTSYCTVFVISKSVEITVIKEESTISPTVNSEDSDYRDTRMVGRVRNWIRTNHDATHPKNRSFEGPKYDHSDQIPWGTK